MKNKNLKYILYLFAIVFFSILHINGVKADYEIVTSIGCGRYKSISGEPVEIEVDVEDGGTYSGTLFNTGSSSGIIISNFHPTMKEKNQNGCPEEICTASNYSSSNFPAGSSKCFRRNIALDDPASWSSNVSAVARNAHDREVINVVYIIGMVLLIIRIVVPILLIVVASFDLIKAMTAKDESSMTPIFKSIILKVVSAIIIFLIPTLVAMLMKLVNQSTLWAEYATCLSHPSTCNTHLWEGIQ